jgi:uncharacterized membrane protein
MAKPTSPLLAHLPEATVLAVSGWVRYVQLATRDLAPTHPVDERMALALAGEKLPGWLETAIRHQLAVARGQALVAQVAARAHTLDG